MKHQIDRSKFLESTEADELRDLLRMDTRDAVIIRFALETGARATEILNLRPQDLFASTSSVLIRALKGGRNRELPVTPELFARLKKYVPFGIKYRRLEQVWRMYRPCEKKFHSLRHTFAVELYRRTRDIKLVQLALGHSSPTATAVYTDFVYSQEEMKRILHV